MKQKQCITSSASYVRHYVQTRGVRASSGLGAMWGKRLRRPGDIAPDVPSAARRRHGGDAEFNVRLRSGSIDIDDPVEGSVAEPPPAVAAAGGGNEAGVAIVPGVALAPVAPVGGEATDAVEAVAGGGDGAAAVAAAGVAGVDPAAAGGALAHAAPAVPGVPVPPEPQDCPVDGELLHAGDRAEGKYYLFTQVASRVPIPGRKEPEDTTREALYAALVATYAAVFGEGHACHNGPEYGLVAREQHRQSPVERSRKVHNHAGCAFSAFHRWKAVEKHMREHHGIKVATVCPTITGGETMIAHLLFKWFGLPHVPI